MEKVKLGDYTEIKTGKLDANASSINGIYPFFTCSNETLKIDKYSYDCECVLVAGNGDLNVKYYDGKFDAYQRTYIIESKDANILDTKYLYYLIRSKIGNLRKNSIGGVIKYIKLGNLTGIEMLPINIGKQKNIVKKLDKIQEVIDLREKQIEELDKLIKSQFVELFGDPILNNKELELKKLSDISVLKAGKAIKTGELESKYIDGFYYCYGGNGIRGYIDRYSHEGEYPIIGRQGALAGNVNFASGKFYATEHAIVVTPKVEMNTLWFYHGLKLLNLMRFQTGAAQPGLAVENINKVEIPFPKIELQNQFAEFVKLIDKQKIDIQKSLGEMQKLQECLMNKYFGG